MPKPKHLIVVGGTTASGKTAFAIRLARHFRTAIVSVDSRQFYQEMNIGTAKPDAAELSQALHHFIGHLSIHSTYSVGAFEKEAMDILEQLFKTHDVVVVSGGSGLYLKAIIEGLDDFPEVPSAIRAKVEKNFHEKGLDWLQSTLKSVDPQYYREVDLHNPHRLIRAIAVHQVSGRPFSSFLNKKKNKRPFIPVYLQLFWPRQQQYERINQRVDQMMASGQVEEAKTLYPFRHLSALQTVGYQELFDHFDGKTSLEEAIELIKQNTRRYAKRQLTWMRRDRHWKHLHPSEWEIGLQYIDLVRVQGISFKVANEKEKVFAIEELAKKGYAFEEWTKIDFLLATRNQEIIAIVPLQSLKKSVLIHPFCPLTSIEEASLNLLRHEAIAWAEDLTIYALFPSTEIHFWEEKGFVELPKIELPPQVRSAASNWLTKGYCIASNGH